MGTIFYRNLKPLTAETHGGLGLRVPLDFGFARTVEAAPLGLSEIPLAAQWYPVAFSMGEQPQAVAMLGMRPGENLFVDEAGAWREGAYVPATIRRYPFLLIPAGGTTVLCVEHDETVLTPGGAALFEGGRPSKLARGAMKFCRSTAADEVAGMDFVRELRRLGLLDGRTATAVFPDGEKLTFSGFQTIDETRFRALDDETFLGLRRRGWLSPIYAQIQSTLNWNRLADAVTARRAA